MGRFNIVERRVARFLREPPSVRQAAAVIVAATALIVVGAGLLAWAWSAAGGLGDLLSAPSRLDRAAFLALFFPMLTAMVGYWATLSLNIPDFTRFARSQRDQVLGQALVAAMRGKATAGLTTDEVMRLTRGPR